jgi:hypothetical protein
MTTEQKLALVEEWKGTAIPAGVFAAQHGLSPFTFYFWTRGRNLGSKRSRPKPEVREQYAKLRVEGMTVARAAYAVGISPATGKKWG